MNIERLLRLAADYHLFCEEGSAKPMSATDPDEMDIAELDLVAAAGNTDQFAHNPQNDTV